MRSLEDLIQHKKHLKKPEIRVWCRNGKEDDYYYTFDTIPEAFEWINKDKYAEEFPLVAINGREYNLFETTEKASFTGKTKDGFLKVKIPNNTKYGIDTGNGTITEKQAYKQWIVGFMENARKKKSTKYKGYKGFIFRYKKLNKTTKL